MGTMFSYLFAGETITALRKFTDRRVSDAIARSLKAKLGFDVEVWYHDRDNEYEIYMAKWFDGDVFHEESAIVKRAF
jgi:hypothetical protein